MEREQLNAFVNEDGSLDIERINELPLEEYMAAMGCLTIQQLDEYLSKLPINESDEPMKAIKVDYGRDDPRSGVDADEFLQQMRERLKK